MLIIIISYIINLLAPIVNTLGIFGLILSIGNDDIDVLIISGVLAIVGLIFGIFAYMGAFYFYILVVSIIHKEIYKK